MPWLLKLKILNTMGVISSAILELQIIDKLKTIFDPEIPVNIYDLGLVYHINISDDNFVKILMTLTSPNCPVAESLPNDVYNEIKGLEGVSGVQVELTFDPPWDKDMLSEEAMLELGLL
jgi:FeS assembly SUF system protein